MEKASRVRRRLERTDVDWADYGDHEPFFGVLAHDALETAVLTSERIDGFYDTGVRYVDRIRGLIETELRPSFQPERALDFGCGVGRITLAIDRWSPHTLGIDTSPGMLRHAVQQARARGHDTVSFARTGDLLPFRREAFEFVHSYIVFQHIPPPRGIEIARQLIESLTIGGIGALHFTYRNSLTAGTKARLALYREVPMAWRLKNRLLKRPDRPMAQMNTYDLNAVFDILHESGCHRTCVRFTDHGPYQGVLLLFEKSPQLFDE